MGKGRLCATSISDETSEMRASLIQNTHTMYYELNKNAREVCSLTCKYLSFVVKVPDNDIWTRRSS